MFNRIIFQRKPNPAAVTANNELTTKAIMDEQKLTQLADRTDMVLQSFSTVFPFDFFPSTVTLDANKINVNDKSFFGSSQVRSVLIKDVKDVIIEMDLFFATLKVLADITFEPIILKFVHKKDALRARRIIMGLRIIYRDGIGVEGLSTTDLITHIENIGKTSL